MLPACTTSDQITLHSHQLISNLHVCYTLRAGQLPRAAGIAVRDPLLKRSFSLCRQVFASLDWCEEILGKQRYIAGDILTEADVRLFQTLIRFDPVYVVS